MKKIGKIILPLLFSFSLCGCSLFEQIIDSITSPTYDNGVEPTKNDVNFSNYLDVVDLEHMNFTGNTKMLVIPVNFEGENLKYKQNAGLLSGGYATTSSRSDTDLYNAFFGDSSDTGWESVSSYYYKSSYGKLNITGEVTPAYTVDCSIYDLLSGNVGGSLNDPTYYILEKAVEWVRNNSDIDLKQYDCDKDGYLDSVFLIYNVDYTDAGLDKADTNDLFWAFTYWDTDTKPSLDKPKPCVYGWASKRFMDDGGFAKPDAHTYIHETGHILGLEDYYTYDTDDYDALGGLDMMDLNIGDHNAFSKSLLGWTNPTHVKEATTYTLRPFESSGDCLIIKPNWEGSFLDEYLIIEYYTPTGLNYADSHSKYSTRELLYSENGIKVLHVDARLGKFVWNTTNDNTTYKGFTTDLIDNYNSTTGLYTYSDIAASNTASRSSSERKLVSLIDASVPLDSANRVKKGKYADNSFLFIQGTGFGYDGKYTTFKFNSGLEVDFGFVVDSLESNLATLTFFALNEEQ